MSSSKPDCAALSVPWVEDGPFRFCKREEAPRLVADWFSGDWRVAVAAVSEWVDPAAHGSDPFAVVSAMSFTDRMPIGKAMVVFDSICDHKRLVFEQKRAMIAAWASAVAGLGPVGEPEADLSLWHAAWGQGAAPGGQGDIHSLDIREMFGALASQSSGIVAGTGIEVCDAFLSGLMDGGSDANEFAVVLLTDALTVEGGLYGRYKGLFGAVLEIMHWPAMAPHARTRIESSLLGAACEHRRSYTTPQAGSSTSDPPLSCSV